jgi:flagellar motor protein MotB
MRRRARALGVTVNYWRAFTDAALTMLLLLVLFIFVQFLANSRVLGRLLVEVRQRQVAAELEQALGDKRDRMTIVTDGNLQRLRFSDAILFDSGEAELKPTGREVLGLVAAPLIARAEWVSEIQIEGHTDPLAIRGRFKSNWELSSARATSVVTFLQSEGGIDPERHPLSATGRSQYVPVVPAQQSPPNRSPGELESLKKLYEPNRRVEIVLFYSERDLQW